MLSITSFTLFSLILIMSLAEVIFTSFPSIVAFASIRFPDELIHVEKLSLRYFNSGWFTLDVLILKSDFIKVLSTSAFFIVQNYLDVGYFYNSSGFI